MNLKAPCEHGRYDQHGRIAALTFCPGGTLLPPDTFRYWVARTDGEPMGDYGGFMVETLDAAKEMVREELEIEQDLIGSYYEADHQLPAYIIEVSVVIERLDALAAAQPGRET